MSKTLRRSEVMSMLLVKSNCNFGRRKATKNPVGKEDRKVHTLENIKDRFHSFLSKALERSILKDKF